MCYTSYTFILIDKNIVIMRYLYNIIGINISIMKIYLLYIFFDFLLLLLDMSK